MGYTNIKIYNGGIKDWKKSGYKLDVIEPLPKYEEKFITAGVLLEKIKQADSTGCSDKEGKNILTIIDFRTENFLKTGEPISSIKTTCNTLNSLLDDLRSPEMRDKIPKDGLVVTVTETGNRDKFVMKYLYKYGYTNVKGLKFGMRGWLKANYPTVTD